uniref:Ig-like domain-containing protein n=1 Tax=Electrophorus electricus TaxID=8005 RepID=A0A4W4F884_ELEEL
VLCFSVYDVLGHTYSAHLSQPASVVVAKSGDNVTLRCSFPKDFNIYSVFWYKQKPGKQPYPVVTARAVSDPIFHDEFNSSRFRVSKSESSLFLHIRNVHVSDEAVYYCGVLMFFEITFGNGSLLTVDRFTTNGKITSRLSLYVCF